MIKKACVMKTSTLRLSLIKFNKPFGQISKKTTEQRIDFLNWLPDNENLWYVSHEDNRTYFSCGDYK